MGNTTFNDILLNSENAACSIVNQYLTRYDLDAVIDNELFQFDGQQHVGEYWGGSVFTGTMKIGINVNVVKSELKRVIRQHPYSCPADVLDEFIKTTIFHEVGHGLVELVNDYLQETNDLDGLYDNNQDFFDEILDNEEDYVEKFALDMFENQVENNDLNKLITMVFNCITER